MGGVERNKEREGGGKMRDVGDGGREEKRVCGREILRQRERERDRERERERERRERKKEGTKRDRERKIEK